MTAVFEGFPTDALAFLKELKRNNNRAWFQKNKKRFDASLTEPARLFVDALGARLAERVPGLAYEPKVNGSILRLARDTRFSKDKTPYKEHLILRFWLGKAKNGPGFWLRFDDAMFGLGAGAMQFDDKALKTYRRRVADGKTGPALTRALASLKRKRYDTMGLHYKRVPKGFDADHPREELLRHRGLFVYREGAVPREFGSKALVTHCLKRCRDVEPVLAWLR